jgi:hypothetical protein
VGLDVALRRPIFVICDEIARRCYLYRSMIIWTFTAVQSRLQTSELPKHSFFVRSIVRRRMLLYHCSRALNACSEILAKYAPILLANAH